MAEFWNEILTKASWEMLQELSKKQEFVLIGGWAVFLWTGRLKSKDIDVVVDFKTLEKMRQEFALVKNERLRKYEVSFEKFDIDIYVPFYSRLALPLDALKSTKLQGIRTVSAEELLILKQAAERARRGSVKARKDAIDILALLVYSGLDLKRYAALLRKHKLEDYAEELGKVVKGFDVQDLKYFDMNLKQFRDWQKEFVGKLRKSEWD